MSDQLLQVKDLSVSIEEGEILHDVNLNIGKGETHVLMGPNGAGKSTLGNTLMGNPVYHVTNGQILFDGEDITKATTDKRARAGMFMSFQNPLEVPGLSLESFIRNALRQQTGQPVKIMKFKKQLEETMELLQMDPSYADRDLNVGFSGGEKKKIEMLQLLLLKPKLAILDETDSGLDVDALKIVSKGIEAYRRDCDGALLMITHNTRILDKLSVDRTHVMVHGNLVEEGPADLITEIDTHGFGRFEQALENSEKSQEA